MFLTTQLELNLILTNINSIYSRDYNKTLLQLAKDRYEKKCYNNQYIDNIINIVKRSLPNIIRRDLNGSVRVFVVVNVSVIVYDEFDIITNMRVSNIIKKEQINNMEMLECKNDHCLALFSLNNKLIGINVGDIIPIRVKTISYEINKPYIIVNISPFILKDIPEVLYSVKPISNADTKYITDKIIPMLNTYTEIKNNLIKDDINNQRWNYFKELLYPYKIKRKNKNNKNILKFDLNGIYKLDNTIQDSDLEVISVSELNENDIPIDIEPSIFYEKLIFKACKEIDTINKMVEIYRDPIVFDNHQHIFKFYLDSKLK
jgi:hypothetical protein